jgi:hypothetical protein
MSGSLTNGNATTMGTVIGSGSDAITLAMSGDAFGTPGAPGADAQFTLNVDGQQIGGLQDVSASHAAGEEQTFTFLGNFAPGDHTATVTFANNDGTQGDRTDFGRDGDRNVYVDKISYNGQTVSDTTTPIYQSPIFPPNSDTYIPGNAVFTLADTTAVPADAPSTPSTTPAAVDVGTGADTLTLHMAEDPFQGDAQFTASVDGQQVGGTLTTTAVAWQGQEQLFNLHGNWGSGEHTATVSFLNDAAGAFDANGAAFDNVDRNLYVTGIDYDGTAAGGTPWELAETGSANFHIAAGGVPGSTGTGTTPTGTTPTGTTPTGTTPVDTTPTGTTPINTAPVDTTPTGTTPTGTTPVDTTPTGTTPTDTTPTDTTPTNTAPVDTTPTDTTPTNTAPVDTTPTGTTPTNTAPVDTTPTDTTPTNTAPVDTTPTGTTPTNTAPVDTTPTGTTPTNTTPVDTTPPGTTPTGTTPVDTTPTGTTPTGTTPVTADMGTVIGSGSDAITLSMSGDAFGTPGAPGADAQFTLNVDGQQIGGLQDVSASHAAGEEQTFTFLGNFAPGDHKVTITFANNDGTQGDRTDFGRDGDRNVYVDKISYNGQTVSDTTTPIYQSPIFPPNSDTYIPGNAVFTVTDTTAVPADAPSTPSTTPAAVDVGTGADTLTLHMAEDPFQGDAQFTVSVDGQQVGGTQTTTAVAWQGQEQLFNLHGDWGSSEHTVTVNFLNDAAGAFDANGAAFDNVDRNLYVTGIDYDGTAAGGTPWELAETGSANFHIAAGGVPNATGTTGSTPATTSDTATVTSDALTAGDTSVGGSSGMSFIQPTDSAGTASKDGTTGSSDTSTSGTSGSTDTTQVADDSATTTLSPNDWTASLPGATGSADCWSGHSGSGGSYGAWTTDHASANTIAGGWQNNG